MIRPKPGTVHRIPIGSSWAYVVVSRFANGAVLGYFYLSPVSELDKLRPEQADLIERVSGLAIKTGEWPPVASVAGWNAAAWPVPEFWHQNSTTKRYVLRRYDDRLRFVGERSVTEEEALQHFEDGQAGSEHCENELSSLAARRLGGQAAAVA